MIFITDTSNNVAFYNLKFHLVIIFMSKLAWLDHLIWGRIGKFEPSSGQLTLQPWSTPPHAHAKAPVREINKSTLVSAAFIIILCIEIISEVLHNKMFKAQNKVNIGSFWKVGFKTICQSRLDFFFFSFLIVVNTHNMLTVFGVQFWGIKYIYNVV